MEYIYNISRTRDLFHLNFKSSRSVSGIIIDDKLLGIYKQNIYKNEIATNIEIQNSLQRLNLLLLPANNNFIKNN